jgi:hypothetical protein
MTPCSLVGDYCCLVATCILRVKDRRGENLEVRILCLLLGGHQKTKNMFGLYLVLFLEIVLLLILWYPPTRILGVAAV